MGQKLYLDNIIITFLTHYKDGIEIIVTRWRSRDLSEFYFNCQMRYEHFNENFGIICLSNRYLKSFWAGLIKKYWNFAKWRTVMGQIYVLCTYNNGLKRFLASNILVLIFGYGTTPMPRVSDLKKST